MSKIDTAGFVRYCVSFGLGMDSTRHGYSVRKSIGKGRVGFLLCCFAHVCVVWDAY